MKVSFFSVHKFTEGEKRFAFIWCKRHEKLAGVYVMVRGCEDCAGNANGIAINRGRRNERRFKQTAPDIRSLEEL